MHAIQPPPTASPRRYFPTILIVLLAVFNDGAMIALSKDNVTPSRLPNRWNLWSIFVSGEAAAVPLPAVRPLCAGAIVMPVRCAPWQTHQQASNWVMPWLILLISICCLIGLMCTAVYCRCWLRPVPHPLLLGAVLRRNPHRLL